MRHINTIRSILSCPSIEYVTAIKHYYHGNPAIYAPDFYNKSVKATMGELYEKTMQREAKIRELGWSVRSIWEQEWSNIKRQMSSCQYGAQSNMS